MASSRASSPSNESNPSSPAQLTPTSKVKAMLAALDDDSDSRPDSGLEKQKSTSNINSTPFLTPKKASRVPSPDGKEGTAQDVESEEDDAVSRPRGRLAAAMQVAHDEVAGKQDEGEATVQIHLTNQIRGRDKASLSVHIGGSDAEGSEADAIPIISRKRRIRRGRDRTPTTSPTNNVTSPQRILVSPTPQTSLSPSQHASGSDTDLPANPTTNTRFMALVEAKRKERMAREAEIQRQKAERAAQISQLSKRHSDALEEDAMEYSDEDSGRRLTQQVRPTRKASKKALEEMHRETQRMSRNMQLAHEARTKKKITKSSLFAKFNYKPAGFVESPSDDAPPTSSSPARQTDFELKDTPPTSPITSALDVEKSILNTYGAKVTQDEVIGDVRTDDDIPILNDVLLDVQASSPSFRASNPDKGKGKAIEELETLKIDHAAIEGNEAVSDLPPLRIRPAKVQIEATIAGNESDSDLEIVDDSKLGRRTKESIFDRIPAKQANQSHSLHALRMLAHVTSPGKQGNANRGKKSMNAVELQMSLQQRARQQATREREERLQTLRDSGVIVQTTEEREKEMADVEDLVAKARREGEEIMKREKAAAKRERKANGVDQPSDNTDDEEWQEAKEDLAKQMSGSGSGSDSDGDNEADATSEEEEDTDEDESEGAISAEEDDNASVTNPAGHLIENKAAESDSAEDDSEGSTEESTRETFDDDDADNMSKAMSEEDSQLPIAKSRRKTRHLVVSDDEDVQDAAPNTSQLLPMTSPMTVRTTDSPKAPHSVLRSATKTFIPGLTVAGPAGLGLTQIFAGTMDDSQAKCLTGLSDMRRESVMEMDTQPDSFTFLQNLPQAEFPTFQPTINADSQDLVRDSQTQTSQIPESPLTEDVSQGIHLHLSQSQVHGFDSMLSDPPATQFSEFPEPTQDGGFQEMSPIQGRFFELAPSTIDTVILEQTPTLDRVAESPVAKKKGKLRRRGEIINSTDDEPSESMKSTVPNDADQFEIPESLFDVMRKASKRKETVVEQFDKKKSGAKEMVHEQAEESEDEYAGLGGASDDESGGEDAYAKEIIDDEGGKDVDESKLAAFYADKERASDEKQVEKLFKDITNGMLRRKRGADYDLSDSDDGGEARRRMKRKEFAKMRKALLEDERIGKIAENPKKLAFLRAIEDRGEDDEMDFLDDIGETQETIDSQSPAQVDGSQDQPSDANATMAISSMGPPKRKLPIDSQSEKRLAPHLRRTQAAKRPSNLSEIRESLSSLIDDPNAILPSQEISGSGSESENDEEGEHQGLRETEKENRDPFASRRKANVSVVDRISLKRATSSTTSTSVRLAFAAPSSTPGFKVPALLRRSTTNSSISSGSSSTLSGTERMAGGIGDNGNFAKKAGKNSGVNYFARENERKIKLEASENKRKEKRWKGAEGRRKVVGGLFGRGKFE